MEDPPLHHLKMYFVLEQVNNFPAMFVYHRVASKQYDHLTVFLKDFPKIDGHFWDHFLWRPLPAYLLVQRAWQLKDYVNHRTFCWPFADVGLSLSLEFAPEGFLIAENIPFPDVTLPKRSRIITPKKVTA